MLSSYAFEVEPEDPNCLKGIMGLCFKSISVCNLQVFHLQETNWIPELVKMENQGMFRHVTARHVPSPTPLFSLLVQSYFSEHISQPLLAAAQKVSLCSPFPANTLPSTPNTSEITANRGSSSPRGAGGGSSSPRVGSSGSRQPLSWLSCAAAAAGKMQAREMALAAALGTGTMGVVLLLMYQKSRSVVHGAGRQMVAA